MLIRSLIKLINAIQSKYVYIDIVFCTQYASNINSKSRYMESEYGKFENKFYFIIVQF